ncbi:MAG: adenylate/guanylate cyclase domain-containing protein [Nitrososphaeraceae archaeon]
MIASTDDILPGNRTTVMIDTNQPPISNHYSIRLAHEGLIASLPKNEDQMTTDESLKFLVAVSPSAFDQENQKILTRLQRQIDSAVIEYLSNPHAPSIQNKILTIVFWDISHFSNLSEKLKQYPELIAMFLNEYLAMAIPIIHEYGGVVDKIMGDGLLAYFGFTEHRDDESHGAINAIFAALKLKRSFRTVKRNWTDVWKAIINSDIDVDIKCGINTGNVLVGLTGSTERDQFSVIGTHVNLASRLEGKAQNDQVIISSYTLAEIKGKFDVETIIITEEEKIKSFENISEYHKVIGEN